MSRFSVKLSNHADEFELEREAVIVKKNELGYECKSELYLQLSEKYYVHMVIFLLAYEQAGETKGIKKLLRNFDENSLKGLRESVLTENKGPQPISKKAHYLVPCLNRISEIMERYFRESYEVPITTLLTNKIHEGQLRVSNYVDGNLVDLKGYVFKPGNGVRNDIVIFEVNDKPYLGIYSSQDDGQEKAIKGDIAEAEKREANSPISNKIKHKEEEKVEAKKEEHPDIAEKGCEKEEKIIEKVIKKETKEEKQPKKAHSQEGKSRQDQNLDESTSSSLVCTSLLLLTFLFLCLMEFTSLGSVVVKWRASL